MLNIKYIDRIKTESGSVAAFPMTLAEQVIVDIDNQFVSATEKIKWNKASTAVATTSDNGLMSSADKTKLDGITFVYNCTGTDDNVAISNLVNDFFHSTGIFADTETINLELKIVGNVGLGSYTQYGNGSVNDPYRYFNFSLHAEKDDWIILRKSVYIDWKSANFPKISGGGDDSNYSFMCFEGSDSIMYHEGFNICYDFWNLYVIYNNSKDSILHINNCYINDCGDNETNVISNNSTGIVHINNCYLDEIDYGIQNLSTGIIYLNNSHIDCQIRCINCLAGTIRINRSELYGSIDTVYNDLGTVYIDSTYCHNSGNGVAVKNNSNGTIHIDNSICIAEGQSTCIGVLNNGAGVVYIDNSTCIGNCNGTFPGASGYGVRQTSLAGKLFINNCELIGHKHKDNTIGKGYGLCVESLDENCAIILSNCYFPKIDKENKKQTGSILLAGKNSGAKYSMIGNVMFAPADKHSAVGEEYFAAGNIILD